MTDGDEDDDNDDKSKCASSLHNMDRSASMEIVSVARPAGQDAERARGQAEAGHLDSLLPSPGTTRDDT